MSIRMTINNEIQIHWYSHIHTSFINIFNALQVYTFLNRVSGPPIGLTAMGMFVVNKPMILTVCVKYNLDN